MRPGSPPSLFVGLLRPATVPTWRWGLRPAAPGPASSPWRGAAPDRPAVPPGEAAATSPPAPASVHGAAASGSHPAWSAQAQAAFPTGAGGARSPDGPGSRARFLMARPRGRSREEARSTRRPPPGCSVGASNPALDPRATAGQAPR